MGSVYKPLGDYLRSLDKQGQTNVVLTFAQVEGILGRTLPATALARPQWWANEKNPTHVQCQAWTGAGWKTRDVDLEARTVRFVKVR